MHDPLPTKELVKLMTAFTPEQGINATSWPQLVVIRVNQPIPCHQVVYKPCICIIAQGRKVAFMGDQIVRYDANNFLVVSLQLPVEAEIIEASPEHPFLALVLEIDPVMVSRLVLDMEEVEPAPSEGPALPMMLTSPTNGPFLWSVIRFLRTLEDPLEHHILGDSLVREILYRVLLTDQGAALRALARRDSNAHRANRVVRFLEQNYAERLDIAGIARSLGMSESTLHHTFKASTSLSPMQYLKKLRLHRARMLMINRGLAAGDAGYRVGYESPSQFSREFKRLFGVPPSRAVESLPG